MFGIGIGKCDGPHLYMFASYWHSNVKGICVDKKQIEDQLKANKSIAYFFFNKKYKGHHKNQKKKIKRCDNESAHLAGTGQ